jgi:hypothetical protein
MIKAKINSSEIVLEHGVFRSDDTELLELVEMLSDDFDRQTATDYFPDRDFAKMRWITERLKGSITYQEEPEPFNRNVVY